MVIYLDFNSVTPKSLEVLDKLWRKHQIYLNTSEVTREILDYFEINKIPLHHVTLFKLSPHKWCWNEMISTGNIWIDLNTPNIPIINDNVDWDEIEKRFKYYKIIK